MKLLGYRTVYTYIAIISPNELKLLLRGKYHCYFKILFALFRPCKVKKLSVTAAKYNFFLWKGRVISSKSSFAKRRGLSSDVTSGKLLTELLKQNTQLLKNSSFYSIEYGTFQIVLILNVTVRYQAITILSNIPFGVFQMSKDMWFIISPD